MKKINVKKIKYVGTKVSGKEAEMFINVNGIDIRTKDIISIEVKK